MITETKLSPVVPFSNILLLNIYETKLNDDDDGPLTDFKSTGNFNAKSKR